MMPAMNDAAFERLAAGLRHAWARPGANARDLALAESYVRRVITTLKFKYTDLEELPESVQQLAIAAALYANVESHVLDKAAKVIERTFKREYPPEEFMQRAADVLQEQGSHPQRRQEKNA